MSAPRTPFVRGAMLVAAKDLRAELRSRTAIQGVAFFAALAVMLFSFAVGADSETLRRLAPGLLWLAVALASLLAVGRSFASEREAGTLQTLLLYPVPREAILAGKLVTSFVLMLVVAIAALAFMSVLYTLPLPEGALLLVAGVPLGAVGLAAVGVFYGAVGANLRAREALMPMLLLPVLVPLLIATTEVTAAALDGGDGSRWLQLLAVFDLVVLTLVFAVFPAVIEE